MPITLQPALRHEPRRPIQEREAPWARWPVDVGGEAAPSREEGELSDSIEGRVPGHLLQETETQGSTGAAGLLARPLVSTAADGT